MKIYTQGTFDLFHVGHIKLLEKCKKIVGKEGQVIVALLTDKAVEKYKGAKPIITFEERKEVLENCVDVDLVIPSDNTKTKQEIKKYKPDFIVVGSDWIGKNIYKQYKMGKELNKLLIYFPYTDTISTSEIKRRINGK